MDLQKTLKMLKDALRFLTEASQQGKSILFVGTKRQAQEAVFEEARRCGQYYVNHRWLGGLLTNWQTAQKSIERLKELDRLADEEGYAGRSKKEISRLERERKHLTQNLAGLKEIPGPPDILFVIDSRKEEIAVAEANRLNIPVLAIVDTNSNPDPVNYVIPGNDDALRAIRLFTSKAADAIVEGSQLATEQDFAEPAPLEGAEGEFAVMTEDGTIVTEKGVVNPDSTAADPQQAGGGALVALDAAKRLARPPERLARRPRRCRIESRYLLRQR